MLGAGNPSWVQRAWSMPKDKDRDLVADILAAAKDVQKYVAGLDKKKFSTDPKTADAVLFRLTVCGEAAGALSQEFKDSHPDLPLRKMTDMRNRIVHGYGSVDLEIVWDTITTDIPPLIKALEALA